VCEHALWSLQSVDVWLVQAELPIMRQQLGTPLILLAKNPTVRQGAPPSSARLAPEVQGQRSAGGCWRSCTVAARLQRPNVASLCGTFSRHTQRRRCM